MIAPPKAATETTGSEPETEDPAEALKVEEESVADQPAASDNS
ncbi:hypothetical protein GCM10022419_015890 [Nonomuraea rosea]|uniref:Uncharacterized protein n=1 Tax=Nonomuraea rosea TaxID=638574 RepID=A0ABP6VMQ2_9ACTN